MLPKSLFGITLLVTLGSSLGVHDDRHATPHCPVFIESEFIYRENVADIMNQVLPLPKEYSSSINYSFEVMKLGLQGGGFDFLCAIPILDTNPASPIDEEAHRQEEIRQQALAKEQALDLLVELKGKCLYYIYGYWTYSYCYPYKMTQFHQVDQRGVPVLPPAPDLRQFFILGSNRPDGETEKEYRHAISSISGELRANETTLLDDIKTDMYIDTKGDTRYLVQKLNHGSKCDITGLNRTTEVQLFCDSTVPASQARINWITEFKTCRYMVGIGTSLLCKSEFFQPLTTNDEPNTMRCFPIIDRENAQPQMEAYRSIAEIIHDRPKNRTESYQKSKPEFDSEKTLIFSRGKIAAAAPTIHNAEPLDLEVQELINQLFKKSELAKDSESKVEKENPNLELVWVSGDSTESLEKTGELPNAKSSEPSNKKINEINEEAMAEFMNKLLANIGFSEEYLTGPMNEDFEEMMEPIVSQASENYLDYQNKLPDGQVESLEEKSSLSSNSLDDTDAITTNNVSPVEIPIVHDEL